MKKSYLLILILSIIMVMYGCAQAEDPIDEPMDSDYYYSDGESNDTYLKIDENQFIKSIDDPTSTFSLDTSTAGYANIRRMINQGQSIPKDSVKIEEMVNYFSYDYDAPTNGNALNVQAEMMDCPWNSNNKIIAFGIKAKEIEMSQARNNIVFLLDVSGSMDQPNKIGLMQTAFKLLADTLKDNDIISVVTYASSDRILIEGVSGTEKLRIVNVIEDLRAGGTTAGARGIQTAYALAEKYFIQDGNNRVVLGTDGDFNVGISSTQDLEEFIKEKRNNGIYLSLLGFGYGNLRDDKLETLANNGDGNYAYIDNEIEARKALVTDFGGTMNIVSKDTKTQVTFNPKYIKEYRLLGYENKLLSDEEFNDENSDAGEIGAGHVTTAVYEIVFTTDEQAQSNLGTDYVEVKIRFKDPTSGESKEITEAFDQTCEISNPSEDLRFISGVVEMGLLLRNSEFKGTASYDKIIERISGLSSVEQDQFKLEFLNLVKKLR